MASRSWGRVIAFMLALASLAGCSMLRLGYSHLDTIAAWRADDYFDLAPEQKQAFRARFARLHEWHRYEQLPDYAQFVAGFGDRLKRGLMQEDVTWFVEGIKARYRIIVRRAAGDAAAMLETITPEQLAALQRRWDKDNRAFVREYRIDAGPDERRHAIAQRALAQIRDWAGELTHEQESRIVALAEALPLIDHLRHADRLRRQREFVELMRLRANREVFQARLTHWLLDWESGRAPEYERALTEWWAKRVDFFVAAARMLTPQQRATAARRLQDYAEDFTRLAQRPGAAAAAR